MHQSMGVQISKHKRKKAVEQGKYVLVVKFFLAKQMHFCLANRISKFSANTRDREVS